MLKKLYRKYINFLLSLVAIKQKNTPGDYEQYFVPGQPFDRLFYVPTDPKKPVYIEYFDQGECNPFFNDCIEFGMLSAFLLSNDSI